MIERAQGVSCLSPYPRCARHMRRAQGCVLSRMKHSTRAQRRRRGRRTSGEQPRANKGHAQGCFCLTPASGWRPSRWIALRAVPAPASAGRVALRCSDNLSFSAHPGRTPGSNAGPIQDPTFRDGSRKRVRVIRDERISGLRSCREWAPVGCIEGAARYAPAVRAKRADGAFRYAQCTLHPVKAA